MAKHQYNTPYKADCELLEKEIIGNGWNKTNFEKALGDRMDYIESNTSNLHSLTSILIQNGVLIGHDRELIDAEKTDVQKNIAFYKIIQKKDILPCLPLLLSTMKNKTMPHVANEILDALRKQPKQITETHEENVATSLDSKSSGIHQKNEPLSLVQNDDFEVTSDHCPTIANILVTKLNQNHWDEIKLTRLSSEIRNAAGRESNMKLDILKCLEEWIARTKPADKVFSKFVKIFDGYPSVKESLGSSVKKLMDD